MKKFIPRKQKTAAKVEPYFLYPDDPGYIPTVDRGNTIKYLTKRKRGSIIKPVIKRKDDKMTNNKNKTSKKSDMIKSVAWLIEAAFRTFVGWVLLTNFDQVVTTASAIYALGTAGVIVITHFVKAHK